MQFGQLKRREFITVVGGTALLANAAPAQQSAMPVVGFLSPATTLSERLRALGQGLKETGYIEGDNLCSHSALPKAKMIDCQHWRWN